MEALQAVARDVYDAALPWLVPVLLLLLGRFGKAVLKRLDKIVDLPHAFDRLSAELRTQHADHERRITHLESLNGVRP
jgi:hypothetical protein